MDVSNDRMRELVSSASGVIIVVIVALVAIWLSDHVIDRVVSQRSRMAGLGVETADNLNRTETISRFLKTCAKVVIVSMAFIAILSEFGIDTAALIASAGVAGIALGFGAQYLVKDYLTGILLVLEDQYRVGDVVEINDITGVVEDVNLRLTVLRDINGTVHNIPNGEVRIASNQSRDFSRVNLDMGLGYSSDLAMVADVIDRTGQELAADADWADKIRTPPAFLRVQDFGDSAIVVKIVGDVEPSQQWAVTGELRRRLKLAFDEAGIEIPFPQRVVHQVIERPLGTGKDDS